MEHDSSGQAGALENEEIEVTREMIQVGVDAFERNAGLDLYYRLGEVYKAMVLLND